MYKQIETITNLIGNIAYEFEDDEYEDDKYESNENNMPKHHIVLKARQIGNGVIFEELLSTALEKGHAIVITKGGKQHE